jgi:hypothetical protein
LQGRFRADVRSGAGLEPGGGAELFAGERRDGLLSTAEHYIAVYRNLLRFVEATLADSPAEPERGKLLEWQDRFGHRLQFWRAELSRIRERPGRPTDG